MDRLKCARPRRHPNALQFSSGTKRIDVENAWMNAKNIKLRNHKIIAAARNHSCSQPLWKKHQKGQRNKRKCMLLKLNICTHVLHSFVFSICAQLHSVWDGVLNSAPGIFMWNRREQKTMWEIHDIVIKMATWLH